LLLLLVGTVIGFVSALFLEVFKHFLEAKRLHDFEQQTSKKNHYEDVAKFLRGDSPNVEKGNVPEPAWLRVVDSEHPNLVSKIIQQIVQEEDLRTYKEKPNRSLSLIQRLWHRKELTLHKKFRDKQVGSKFLIGPLNIMGRNKTCDIRMSFDPSVSREHAMIRYEKNKFFLYDLGSANGTSLNGKMLEKQGGVPLAGGELISIGKTTFQFGLVDQDLITDQEPSSAYIQNSDVLADNDVAITDCCPIHGIYDASLDTCPYCLSESTRLEN